MIKSPPSAGIYLENISKILIIPVAYRKLNMRCPTKRIGRIRRNLYPRKARGMTTSSFGIGMKEAVKNKMASGAYSYRSLIFSRRPKIFLSPAFITISLPIFPRKYPMASATESPSETTKILGQKLKPDSMNSGSSVKAGIGTTRLNPVIIATRKIPVYPKLCMRSRMNSLFPAKFAR